jgi:hypothetical protein
MMRMFWGILVVDMFGDGEREYARDGGWKDKGICHC